MKIAASAPPKRFASAAKIEPIESVSVSAQADYGTTIVSARFLAVAAMVPVIVIAASAMNQKPRAGKVGPVFGGIVPVAIKSWRMPKPTQKDPHVPCMAVAIASRAAL